MLHFKTREGGDIYTYRGLINAIYDAGSSTYLQMRDGGHLSLFGSARENKRIYDGEVIDAATGYTEEKDGLLFRKFDK